MTTMTTSLFDVTGTDYDTYMHSAFHKALRNCPCREVDDFDVFMFQIYSGICLPVTISIQKVFTKLLQK